MNSIFVIEKKSNIKVNDTIQQLYGTLICSNLFPKHHLHNKKINSIYNYTLYFLVDSIRSKY